MSYQYDVFLSYNRKFPHGQWVDEMFYPLFVPYLEDALNQDVSVFKDTEDIEGGSAWPQSLTNALAHSRCMVSIFSPSYFRSSQCMKEFSVMYNRQKQLGYLSQKKPTGLIVPVKIFDGEHFPGYAKQLQMLNCIQFNRVGEGVKTTKLYSDFQGVLQTWVYDVATAIRNAPRWDPSWVEQQYPEFSQTRGISKSPPAAPNDKPTVRKPTL